MEITHLKEFVVLSDILNYGEAAEQLYIAQSVLSKHIKSLEKELGSDLFIRGSRSIELTEFGRIYLPYAVRIVEMYEESENKRKSYLSQRERLVHFGVGEDFQLYEYQLYMTTFVRKYPDYRFALTETLSGLGPELFEKNQFNMFATALSPTQEFDFNFIPVATGHMQALIRKDHPLANGKSLRLEQLGRETIILPSVNTVFLTIAEETLNKLLPNKHDYIRSSYNAAKMIVDTDSDIAILHEEALHELIPDTLKIMEIEPAITYTRGVAYRCDGLNEAEQAFIEFAIEMSGRLAPSNYALHIRILSSKYASIRPCSLSQVR